MCASNLSAGLLTKWEFRGSKFGLVAPAWCLQLLPYVVPADIPGGSVTARARLVSSSLTKEELQLGLKSILAVILSKGV